MSGYGCEDHFLEGDTYLHCWQVIAELLRSDLTDDLLCDIGMPVEHRNVRYNCRVYLLNRRVLAIRPKLALADDGNYRESRWFTAWRHRFEMQPYYLPRTIRDVYAERLGRALRDDEATVPFGDVVLALADTALASETCEELFTPDSPHIALSLDGVEILGNGSGSHHELRKLHKRVDLIRSATSKCGGIYLYANQQCCDGGRLYFDGCALIAANGRVYAQGSQFSMREVEVLVATLDLSDVRVYRGQIASRGVQASSARAVPRVHVPFALAVTTPTARSPMPSAPIEVKYHSPPEEIGYGPACWLWDYLRRSGLAGFFLPLSGGADSAATAAIVGIMCTLVVQELAHGNAQVITDVRRILGLAPDAPLPASSQEFASRIFHTAYLASVNSGEETRSRAARIAAAVGATHHELQIDSITAGLQSAIKPVLPREPRFRMHGGSATENLALQNIQARSRMVLSYFLAQLLPWGAGRTGTLLVLGSGNVDEALRGYLTKYDCSSADINPIGGISKGDLKSFLLWAATAPALRYTVLAEVATATPTAELEPSSAEYVQSDEADMGMSYEELGVFGRLRKMEACGPVAMFLKLVHRWPHLTPRVVADKVKHFFRMYSINRHKVTTLTPSYHAEGYSPDDNRFDLRPFLYNARWPWQFREIDRLVERMESEQQEQPHGIKRVRQDDEGAAETEGASAEDLVAQLAAAQQRVAELTARLVKKARKE